MRISKKNIKRFLKHVKKTRSCWLWTASKMWKGYGNFRLTKKKLFRTHRFAYLIFKGPIPRKKFVCHRCDVRHCVNPKHLWLGNAEQNSKDMMKKKRQAWGEELPHSVLTKKKVKQIRKIYKTKKITYAKLARRYHVNASVISEAIRKISWRNLR